MARMGLRAVRENKGAPRLEARLLVRRQRLDDALTVFVIIDKQGCTGCRALPGHESRRVWAVKRRARPYEYICTAPCKRALQARFTARYTKGA